MIEVMECIRNSKAYSEGILRLRNDAKKYTGAQRLKMLKTANYLEAPEECFARAYAQFIATESKNPQLLKELDATRDPRFYQSQWADEDFKPVHKAIKNFLKSKGWM